MNRRRFLGLIGLAPGLAAMPADGRKAAQGWSPVRVAPGAIDTSSGVGYADRIDADAMVRIMLDHISEAGTPPPPSGKCVPRSP